MDVSSSNSKYEVAAKLLREAYSNKAIHPLRDTLLPMDALGAYSIQSINTRFWRSQGRRVIGHKIGLTATAVQIQLGVGQPDYGVLFADMSIPNGGALHPSQVLQPKVEAEVALIMAKDVKNLSDINIDHNTAMSQFIAAIDHVRPAIEIVDSRIEDWKITFADTVADNGSSAFFVLGDDKSALEGLDLYSCGMVLEINGVIQSLGAGAACLGHPLNAAVWLARTLNELGEEIHAGDVILTGALGPTVPIKPGDYIDAKIGGLGSVAFSYKDDVDGPG